MASSPPKKSCFHCNDSNSLEYRDGWQLRNGDFSLLCDQCASAYEDGRFCEIFHSDSDGWRDCDSCGKLVHCGCIMSLHAYMLLDFGGVICTECSRKNFIMASNRCPSSLWSATPAQLLRHLTDPVEVKQLDDTKGVISGINHGADPIGLFDCAVRYSLPNESNGQTLAPETLSQIQAPPPQLGEFFHSNSLDEADTSHEAQIEYGKPQGDANGKIHLQPQHWPKISDHELLQISRNSNLVVIPLFEKTLSVSDADPKLGRLVIPKKYAEAYLPKISQAQGFPLKVHDTRGKEWVFHFRFWPNNNSKMYVLEGIKDYMISMQWQPGDKVIFYQIGPEGNLVMGLKKASSVLPPLKIKVTHFSEYCFYRNLAQKRPDAVASIDVILNSDVRDDEGDWGRLSCWKIHHQNELQSFGSSPNYRARLLVNLYSDKSKIKQSDGIQAVS